MEQNEFFTYKLENLAELINQVLSDMYLLESKVDEEEEKNILSDTLKDLAELRINILNYINKEEQFSINAE
jgi:hypothetical protein